MARLLGFVVSPIISRFFPSYKGVPGARPRPGRFNPGTSVKRAGEGARPYRRFIAKPWGPRPSAGHSPMTPALPAGLEIFLTPGNLFSFSAGF